MQENVISRWILNKSIYENFIKFRKVWCASTTGRPALHLIETYCLWRRTHTSQLRTKPASLMPGTSYSRLSFLNLIHFFKWQPSFCFDRLKTDAISHGFCPLKTPIHSVRKNLPSPLRSTPCPQALKLCNTENAETWFTILSYRWYSSVG